MFVLGLILLIVGLVTALKILLVIGIVLAAAGLLLEGAGYFGRPVGGRRHWY